MIKKLQQVELKCSSIEEMKYQYSINYSDKFNLIGYRLKKNRRRILYGGSYSFRKER